MTERERRAVLRRRPHVTSWRRLLEAARSEYEQVEGNLEPAPAAAAGATTLGTTRLSRPTAVSAAS